MFRFHCGLGSVLLTALTTLSLMQPAAAHDDPKGALPVYSGRGWDRDEGGPPPLDFPADGIQLLSWFPVTEFNPAATSGNVAWGYVSPSGREYALMGFSHGTAFVEVTDPVNAAIIEVISGPISLWRDLKVYQHYAYAVSEAGMGIQIMDMSQIDDGVVTLSGTVTIGGSAATHTVALNADSGYLYRCGGGNGLRMYSLANPAVPAFVGTTLNGLYVHEAQVVSYTEGPYAGKEIAFCFTGSTGTVHVLDVTNKSAVLTLSFLDYSNSAYSHQGWLSPDKHYLYIDDEFDEGTFGLFSQTRIIDVSNLSAPLELPGFMSGVNSVDHNLYTHGHLIYESNYLSGLRVFDASNPVSPVQIAWFDTHPESDAATWDGLWSNYPWLPSGTVLGGDMQNGLFIWTPAPVLDFSFPAGLPELLDTGGASIEVVIGPLNGGVVAPGTAKLFYDVGRGFVETELVSLGGDLFEAVFPDVACGQGVSYYFTAATTSGISVRHPLIPPTAHSATAAAESIVAVDDALEVESGWTVGAPGDNATTGVWVRVDPNGTSAQPEDDHTADPGAMCFVTGQGTPGAHGGEADVDGGTTTLFSPVFDLSAAANASISYWRWYSNHAGGNPAADVFTVDVSNDGGQTWINVETVGPGGIQTQGEWFQHEFQVSDFVALTDQVQLRFAASDEGGTSVIEAAIDDLQITAYACDAIFGDIDFDGDVDLSDYADLSECLAGPDVAPVPVRPPTPDACLAAFDVENDLDVDLFDAAEFQTAFTGTVPSP